MSIVLAILAAAPFADLAAIDRQVAAFTGAGIGAAGGAMQPVDRRLRLRSCASTPQLSWRAQRRDTVVVRCAEPGGWRLFVPVAPSGGTGLQEVAALPAVKRGDAVSLAVEGDGFTVSRPAEALESGAVGTWIRVRPVTERGIAADPVRARVRRPGLVALPVE